MIPIQGGERRKRSGNMLKTEYKGSRVLQQRFACTVILIINVFTMPEVQNALWAAAQESSAALGDGNCVWREQ